MIEENRLIDNERQHDVCNNANLPLDEISDNDITPSLSAKQLKSKRKSQINYAVHEYFGDCKEFINDDVTWDLLGMRIKWTTPKVPGSSLINAVDPLDLKVCVEFEKPLRLQKFSVHAWTNLYHADNTEGINKPIQLPYVEGSRDWDDDGVTRYTFQKVIYPSEVGDYNLMFYVQRGRKILWASKSEKALMVKVIHEQEDNMWTNKISLTQITKYISIGNVLSVLESDDLNFTGVISLDQAVQDSGRKTSGEQKRELISVPLPPGASREIPSHTVAKVALKLLEYSNRQANVLMGDRQGQGRVGSMMVAYIYANNPCLSFQEAYDYVRERRQIYCHKGLKNILPELYPRE